MGIMNTDFAVLTGKSESAYTVTGSQVLEPLNLPSTLITRVYALRLGCFTYGEPCLMRKRAYVRARSSPLLQAASHSRLACMGRALPSQQRVPHH